jgi:hypothetical protein
MNLAIFVGSGQCDCVLENQETARRWTGYVCPDCRFVFRVARDHDGSGIVCPSCRRLLRLPGTGDTVPPLLVEQLLRSVDSPEQPGADGMDRAPRNVRRKRKRKRRESGMTAWEEKAGHSRRGRDRNTTMILAAGLVALIAIVGTVYMMTLHGEDSQAVDHSKATEDPGFPEAPTIASLPDGSADSGPELDQGTPDRDNARFHTDAHPIARAFLEAKTVEERLKVVDRPEIVAERIRRHHPDGTIESEGLGDYSHFSQIRMIGSYAIVPLRTRDFRMRMMTFRVDPDGLKVDWESWVGWSDMAWDDFIEQRPQGAHAFRVNLAAVEYYNFEFADDRKWQSFRVISPDEQHALYGYVERDSPAHVALRSTLDEGFTRAFIELRFAENAANSEQVEITRVVAENWLDPDRLAEP